VIGAWQRVGTDAVMHQAQCIAVDFGQTGRRLYHTGTGKDHRCRTTAHAPCSHQCRYHQKHQSVPSRVESRPGTHTSFLHLYFLCLQSAQPRTWRHISSGSTSQWKNRRRQKQTSGGYQNSLWRSQKASALSAAKARQLCLCCYPSIIPHSVNTASQNRAAPLKPLAAGGECNSH
jgi:hypothetical protein